MGFLTEFKEDFSEAVNVLVPGGQEPETLEDDTMVDTLGENIDAESELAKLDGLLEQVSKRVDEKEQPQDVAPVEKKAVKLEEEVKMSTNVDSTPVQPVSQQVVPVSDETAVITKGMAIKGNIESAGSVEVEGMIDGDIACNGKLVVTGSIHGNSSSSEFFADAAKIEGEVTTTGTAKVGVGSVIIGNISATSAVIAGAVKGDIDVQGPVVVDTSAVVMGNIKSRSVQINNGAVIEGFCSQCYADVDVEGLFA